MPDGAAVLKAVAAGWAQELVASEGVLLLHPPPRSWEGK